MNLKLCKTVYHLTRNARITTKELGKKTGSTQQTASYTKQQLKKKKTILGYATIVDAVKFGFTNIIVGINYLKFDSESKKKIIDDIKENQHIIEIQEGIHGVDLLLEYSVLNLSSFNKYYQDVSIKFKTIIETKFIFPVVVKHYYNRKYLIRKPKYSDKVLMGDRETKGISEKEHKVLLELVKKPNAKLVEIANKTQMPAKTIVAIKKRLETNKIIRGYKTLFNLSKLGIRKQYILLKLSSEGIEDIDKITAYAVTDDNIVEMIKLIGEYQIMIVAEYLKKAGIINELRERFNIKDYLVIDIEKILKEEYLPQIK